MRFLFVFLALLIICTNTLASEVFWLRGNDETVQALDGRHNSLLELGPGENSNKTVLTKAISEKPAVFAEFYHEPLGADVNLSGNAALWISEIESDSNASIRFSVIDFNPQTGKEVVIFQSDWTGVFGKTSVQQNAESSEEYLLDKNDMLKLSIDAQGGPGNSLSMVLDEGSKDSQISWTSPDGVVRILKGVSNAAALFIEGGGFPGIRCANSFDCSDLDISTTDVCYNPQTFRSFCSNEKPNCTVDCSSNNECDSNGYCINAGTCASYCSGHFVANENPGVADQLLIEILQTNQSVYKKGSFVRVAANATGKDGAKTFGAKLEGQTSTGISFPMREIDAGLYEGFFQVPYRTPTGTMKIRVLGKKEEKEGFDEITIRTISPKINIDIGTEKTQPLAWQDKVTLVVNQGKNFEIGEKIRFNVKATYERIEPVVTENAFMTINGTPFTLKAIDKGRYQGEYTIKSGDEGPLAVKVSIDDGFNNTHEETAELFVSGESLLHFLSSNAVLIILVLMIVGAVTGAGFIFAQQKAKIALLHKRESEIIGGIKVLQTRYFVNGNIDKVTYSKNMQELEPELKKLREEIAKLESYNVSQILKKEPTGK